MAEPAVAGDDMVEAAKKQFSICIIQENLLTGVTTGGEMIDCSGIL